MFHLNGFRLCSPSPVQMDLCWSIRSRLSRLDGGDGGEQGEVKVQRG